MMNTATKRLFEAGGLENLTWDRHSFEESLTATILDFYAATGGVAPANGQVAHAVHALGTLQSAQFRLNDQTFVTVRPFFDWGNAFNDGRLYPSKIGFCGLAFKSLGILNDGRVILCCGDYDGDTALGSLAQQSLPEILLSERAQAVSRAMNHLRLIDPRCQQCFASSNPLKTALKVVALSGMFKILKPGPGKKAKIIDPLS
jgi:radical SAM protein with 4Fe4S-binding SPASM domain